MQAYMKSPMPFSAPRRGPASASWTADVALPLGSAADWQPAALALARGPLPRGALRGDRAHRPAARPRFQTRRGADGRGDDCHRRLVGLRGRDREAPPRPDAPPPTPRLECARGCWRGAATPTRGGAAPRSSARSEPSKIPTSSCSTRASSPPSRPASSSSKGHRVGAARYAWIDPPEVARYVAAHADKLSALSRREALKNISRTAAAASRRQDHLRR